MQNISEQNIITAQPHRHSKTMNQTASQKAGTALGAESSGLSAEELRKIVADLLG